MTVKKVFATTLLWTIFLAAGEIYGQGTANQDFCNDNYGIVQSFFNRKSRLEKACEYGRDLANSENLVQEKFDDLAQYCKDQYSRSPEGPISAAEQSTINACISALVTFLPFERKVIARSTPPIDINEGSQKVSVGFDLDGPHIF